MSLTPRQFKGIFVFPPEGVWCGSTRRLIIRPRSLQRVERQIHIDAKGGGMTFRAGLSSVGGRVEGIGSRKRLEVYGASGCEECGLSPVHGREVTVKHDGV